MLTFQTADITENWPSSKTESNWAYNGLDCCITLEVLHQLLPQLDNISQGVYNFSRALQGPVLDINMRGILVDMEARNDAIQAYSETIARLENNLDRIIREGIGSTTANWRSPEQLKVLFYDTLGFPPRKFHGKVTTRRDALEKLAQEYMLAEPIVAHILTLRDLGKKVSTIKTRISDDGRIYTSINIAGTNTGRVSSSFSEFEEVGGNLQNIEELLRRIFISDQGMKFAYIDLEQAESRALGAICWNKFHIGNYLDACESGDLHTNVVKMTNPGLFKPGDPRSEKEIAETPFYRHHTYRHMNKILGHGCLTEDHEVLTPNGWLSIAKKPPMILSWDESISSFSEVTNWNDFEFTGELHSFEGNSISALMTPDHRVPFRSDVYTGFLKTRRADEGPGPKMPLGSGYIGGQIDCPARLIAAFMADGSQNGEWASFHFKKDRKIKRLLHLCDEEGITPTVYNNSDGTVKINIKASWPKRPGSFMFQWSAQCLRDFIDELKYWDGYIGSTAISIHSSLKEDLEWYQTFGRILGIGGSINGPRTSGFGTIMWSLQQNNRSWATGANVKHSKISVEKLRVFCPTVATGWFYVRRNGKIFITGNSNYEGQPHTMQMHTKIPADVIREFQRKYFSAFPELPLYHGYVKDTLLRDGYLISLMGRRRWFFGRRNDPEVQRAAIAFDPQGSVGDILNTGMLKVWQSKLCILLLQVHDAILVEYPEETEDEILPQLLKLIQVPVHLEHGRTLIIPSEAKVGWNWASAADDNPDGLIKYKGHDKRTRTKRAASSLLDRRVSAIT